MIQIPVACPHNSKHHGKNLSLLLVFHSFRRPLLVFCVALCGRKDTNLFTVGRQTTLGKTSLQFMTLVPLPRCFACLPAEGMALNLPIGFTSRRYGRQARSDGVLLYWNTRKGRNLSYY
jgi:hypothetical protein